MLSVTVKEKVEKPVREVLTLVDENTKDYLGHLHRTSHQHKTMKNLKENLGDNDLVVHVDFSENNSCKYAVGAQSVHLGNRLLYIPE